MAVSGAQLAALVSTLRPARGVAAGVSRPNQCQLRIDRSSPLSLQKLCALHTNSSAMADLASCLNAAPHAAASCPPRCMPVLRHPGSQLLRQQLWARRPRSLRYQHAAAAVGEGATQAPDPPAAPSGTNGNGSHGMTAAGEAARGSEPAVPPAAAAPLYRSPEDFKLQPGEVSPINRSAPLAPEDVFRCAACTEPACQVGSSSGSSSS